MCIIEVRSTACIDTPFLLCLDTATMYICCLFFGPCRRSLVMPRRNPSRKARPAANGLDYRPVTRSMTRVKTTGDDGCELGLVEGLKDDQEIKRIAIRSRCVERVGVGGGGWVFCERGVFGVEGWCLVPC